MHLVMHRLNLLVGECAVFAAIAQTECLAALIFTELTAFEAIDQFHGFQQGLPALRMACRSPEARLRGTTMAKSRSEAGSVE